MNRLAGLAVAALLGLSVRAYGFETEATITNTNGEDLVNLPVFAKVSSVFGNGIDFTQLNPSGFHIYRGPTGKSSSCTARCRLPSAWPTTS